MENTEGDEIILTALRQIECGSIGADITTIAQLAPEMIVEIVAKSLLLITEGDAKFPTALPSNIASRHRICTNMCVKVKELGFPQSIGYNQLLYPQTATTKELLFWLVQKLPRQEEDTSDNVLGPNALRNARMTEALTEWVNTTWKLYFCTSGVPARNLYNTKALQTAGSVDETADFRQLFKASQAGNFGAESTIYEQHVGELLSDIRYAKRLENDLEEGEEAMKAKQALIDAQVKSALGAARQNLAAAETDKVVSLADLLSDITDGSAGNDTHGRGTRFTHASEFGQEKAGTTGNTGPAKDRFGEMNAALDAEDEAALKARLEKEERGREEELESLRQSVEDTTQKLALLDRTAGNSQARIRQLESELERLLAEGEAMERDILIKRKTLEMLPNATANIAKLQGICGASSAKLLQLAQEWEKHRRPLLDQIRTVQNTSGDRRVRCKEMMEEMKSCRAEMGDMIADLKEKQQRAQQLADEMSKLPKNINRTVYTHRIMDIIDRINKQSSTIEKITSDIRNIQKTINSTEATLSRSDAVAEEAIFAAANAPKSDIATVETYRGLTKLRAEFEKLMDCATSLGANEKLSRDLEVKIEQEMARVTSNNFDRIRADLKSVKGENAAIVAQLKAM